MAVTELLLVRHGESIGNVAREEAESSGASSIAMPMRDADVPLSELGVQQARAVGRWLAEDPDRLPTAVWTSPYLRARQTAQTALAELPSAPPLRQDERIRDRELGVLDLLTKRGVTDGFPAEAHRRSWLGKFYYRPPGGESWADVALRTRSLLATEALRHDGERLVCFTHQAVVMVFRYVLEDLTETDLLDIDRGHQVANTSVTRYHRAATGAFRLEEFNGVDHLAGDRTPDVTEENDVPSPA